MERRDEGCVSGAVETSTGPGAASPDDREARARARNRAALAWIAVLCVVMATLGFLFALWLRGRPSGH